MAIRLKTMSEFASELIGRTEVKFDSLLITDSGGVKGTGKSTFSMDLNREIAKQKGFKFSIRDMTIFDPTNEKIVDSVKLRPIAYPVHVDEASKVAYKRNYAQEQQKRLIIFANVCRKYYKIININNPKFWGLDKDLLELADFRIIILKRGVAQVFGKIKNPDTEDVWCRKDTDEMITKYVKNLMDVDQIINVLRNAKNYIYEIHFGSLDAKIYEVYEKMSQDAELQSFYESQENQWRHASLGFIGLIEYMIKNGASPLSSRDISFIVNYAIRQRRGSGSIIPSRIRQMQLEADSIGLALEIENMIKKKVDIHHSVVAIPLFNNNNNAYTTNQEKGGAGGGVRAEGGVQTEESDEESI